jgi:hypothetical protein
MARILEIETCDECPHRSRATVTDGERGRIVFACQQRGEHQAPVIIADWHDETTGVHPDCPLRPAQPAVPLAPVPPEALRETVREALANNANDFMALIEGYNSSLNFAAQSERHIDAIMALLPQWTPVTPETMPPMEDGVILLYERHYPHKWSWIDAGCLMREAPYNVDMQYWCRLPTMPALPAAPAKGE